MFVRSRRNRTVTTSQRVVECQSKVKVRNDRDWWWKRTGLLRSVKALREWGLTDSRYMVTYDITVPGLASMSDTGESASQTWRQRRHVVQIRWLTKYIYKVLVAPKISSAVKKRGTPEARGGAKILRIYRRKFQRLPRH